MFDLLFFHLILGFLHSSVGKESTCRAGDPGLIPGSGRSAGEGIGSPLQYSWTSLVAQLVKNLAAMWETLVQFLGWEDPLERGKATHSIFWPGEFHGLYSLWGCKELDMTEQLYFLSFYGTLEHEILTSSLTHTDIRVYLCISMCMCVYICVYALLGSFT